MTTPHIFGYLNYRQYLSDVYEVRKQGRGFSYRLFSKLSGFTSPNFIKLVIDGERNLSDQAIFKVAHGLKLHGHELEYFKQLVAMNQATSDEDRVAHLSQLKAAMPHGRSREIGADGVAYLSSWLYPVLRELVQTQGFREDPYWIARRLRGRVSQEQIREALDFLVSGGYVRRDACGRLEAADDVVLSTDEVKSLAVRSHHRCMLQEAVVAMETLPVEAREFGAMTVAIPTASIPELKERIKNFRKEIHTFMMAQMTAAIEATAATGNPADNTVLDSEIVQLNIQMFPHTGISKPAGKAAVAMFAAMLIGVSSSGCGLMGTEVGNGMKAPQSPGREEQHNNVPPMGSMGPDDSSMNAYVGAILSSACHSLISPSRRGAIIDLSVMPAFTDSRTLAVKSRAGLNENRALAVIVPGEGSGDSYQVKLGDVLLVREAAAEAETPNRGAATECVGVEAEAATTASVAGVTTTNIILTAQLKVGGELYSVTIEKVEVSGVEVSGAKGNAVEGNAPAGNIYLRSVVIQRAESEWRVEWR